MLALILLAAAAQAIPVPKIIPVFELAEHQTRVSLENIGQFKAPCLEDCHHYILDHPVYIIAQPEENGQYMVHFAHEGLNGLGRSRTLVPFNDRLAQSQVVTLMAPLGKFPFELFPGILQQEMHIPEHNVKLIDMWGMTEAPVVAIIPEVDFKKIGENNLNQNQVRFNQVADLVLQDNVYRIGKDHALAHRLAPGVLQGQTGLHGRTHLQQLQLQQQQQEGVPQFVQYGQQPVFDLHQVRLVPWQQPYNPLELRTNPIIPQQIHHIGQIGGLPLIHPQATF